MQTQEPVGRQAELGQIEAFLDALPAGATALAVTGIPGIGKTTLWWEGVRRAQARGHLVLTARATQAEARLSFAGLADLVRPVGNESFEALPAVQRNALDVALLRVETRSSRHDGRIVPTALLSLLQVLARRTCVLLAVDDAQWLDTATQQALSFAVHRLEGLPVGVLVSVRTEDDRTPTFELAVPIERRRDVSLGPLSTAALHDIVKRQLGHSFPRPTIVQIAALSGGNPLYAVEIARELDRTGIPPPGTRLPVPGGLLALARSRVARLPRKTRDALLVASCLTQPTVALVDAEAIAPADEAGVARVEERGVIRFTHPLLASAVYESASGAQRRRVHGELARRVADPEERARHLGLAATGPDEKVAAELDAAAERAVARGAMAAGCDLCRRALELTEDPHGPMAARRALVLARHLLDVGRTHEAKMLMEAALTDRPAGELLAQVLFRLGEMCWYERDFERGYAHTVEALHHTDDHELAGRIHTLAAWISETVDLGRAIRHVDAALELLDPDRSPGAYSRALMYGAYLKLIDGQGAAHDAIERGIRMQQGVAQDDRSPVPIVWPGFADDFALARQRYEAAVAEASALGEEADLQAFYARLSEIEVWAGNWPRADELASAAMALTDRIASPTYLGWALFARGYVDAHLGRIEAARVTGERILELFQAGFEPQLVLGHALLGFLALSLQDFAGADRHLARASEIVDEMGQREPVRYRFHPDHVEAVIMLGELERAEGLIARLDERGRVFPRPWILATTARCRGLWLSARGELDGALEAMREALRHHERLEMPFERARTLLALGQVLRRRREKREARAALEQAVAEFDRLGAPLWAERASSELARIPVRQHLGELTPTEEQVAAMAAMGRTNRQIAEALFLSPKTVEVNLTRVYRKLGVRSRTALAARAAGRQPET